MVELKWLVIPKNHVIISERFYKKVDEQIDTLESFSYLFAGICGNGKTTLSLLIRDALQRRLKLYNDERGKAGDNPIEILCNPIMDTVGIWNDYVYVINSGISDKADAIWKRNSQLSKQVVFLNDIGAEEKKGQNAVNYIATLIEAYYDYRKIVLEPSGKMYFCVMTTNYTSERMNEALGTRAFDRMQHMHITVPFKHQSFRESKAVVEELRGG